jgi:hypothetical protein
VPLPGGITVITVTGTFLHPSGTPASGTVTLDPGPVTLTDSAGHVILAAPVTATLSGSGQVSVVIPCTDDETLSGGPFTYSVTVALDGLPGATYPGKSIPHTLGASVDLSALLP